MENGYNAESSSSALPSSSSYAYPYVNCCSSYDTYGTYSFTDLYGSYEMNKYYQQLPNPSNQYPHHHHQHNQTQIYYPHYRTPIASTSNYAHLFLNGTIPNNYYSTPTTTIANTATVNYNTNSSFGRGNRFVLQRPKYAWMLEREKDHQQSRHFQQPIRSTTDTVITSQTGNSYIIFDLLRFSIL
ncbi:unnamed protein product [Onchocerca flexuosa]|uniref:Uncharacterized protein n=1 Tax=Onchocerca flexuosa TaxID=387005 RepID=A0A183I5H0_9BILA|nr:unnamed protein product [Onchocerca flexuosa]